MSNKVIYLTGIPGSGKTTATSFLEAEYDNLKVFRYGDMILEKLKARNPNLVHSELRSQSSSIISVDDFDEIDELLFKKVEQHRISFDIIIESHGVTRENYGFRITPFKNPNELLKLGIHSVVYISCDSDIILDRMVKLREGRKVSNREQLEQNARLQENLALIYATTIGCPLYILENNSSDISFKNQLRSTFSHILNH